MPFDASICSSSLLNDVEWSAPSLISATTCVLVERTPAASDPNVGDAESAQPARRKARRAACVERLRARTALV